MIRLANKFDKPQIIEMMKSFREESGIQQYKELNNEPYVNELLDSIFAGLGVAYIDDGKGVILGLIAPNIWCNKHYGLHELMWYVKPEYRHTTTGYRLLKAYINYGNELKKNGRIILFTLSKLSSSPYLKYEKFGFKKIDENWMQ
jgi:N-acetylglutamate synthase-like GNAT family acetyltransferase